MFKYIFVNGQFKLKVELNEIEEGLKTINFKEVTFEEFESMEDAQNFADKFPKYLKVRARSCFHYDEKGNYETYGVNFEVSWKQTKVTGEENEQSIKRMNGFIKTLKKVKLID